VPAHQHRSGPRVIQAATAMRGGGQQQAEGPSARGRHYPAAGGPATHVEVIPLCELRRPPDSPSGLRPIGGAAPGAEALKQLHAQSSAETSGVGDSLQRIHALSSTETSGYGGGDTVQSPTDLASITSPLEQHRGPACTSVLSALPEYQSTVSAAPSTGPRSTAPRSSGREADMSSNHRYNSIASPVQGTAGACVQNI